MQKIHIGRTIEFKWKIKTNGQDIALEGRDLTAEIIGPNAYLKALEYEITDVNTIVATWQGTDVLELGSYRFVLWENKDKDNQTVVDIDAVTIVPTTKEES